MGIAVSPRGRYTTGWDERVSLGIEQRLPVIALRAGYAKGQDGFTALTGGLGVGIGPVLLYTAAEHREMTRLQVLVT